MRPHDADAGSIGAARRDDPPFEQPWHAELFALTHSMARAGHFRWSDWAAHFAAALKDADAAGAPKDGSAYYEIWLTAFETFLEARGLADTRALGRLKRAWTDAYLTTPHGEPVTLAAQRRPSD